MSFAINVPAGKLVASYGGGVNSVAVQILLKRLGVVPIATVMVDPGDEWKKTYQYRDEIMQPWLRSVGFPPITTITRAEEGRHRSRAWRLETLRGECLRTKSLPSVAYGWKKCSQKYKGDTQRWWIRRQPWALETWREFRVAILEPGKRTKFKVRVDGERLIKVIGYDVDEMRRVRRAFQDPWENDRFVPFYPLVEAKLGRDECEELIASEGLPIPGKSACKFCPNNKLAEWERLRREEPEGFAEAVEMSQNAAGSIESPDVVGLMRCNPHGKRQLHIWAEGGYEAPPASGTVRYDEDDERDAMPCECAL